MGGPENLENLEDLGHLENRGYLEGPGYLEDLEARVCLGNLEQLVQLENLEPVAGPEAEEADLAHQGLKVVLLVAEVDQKM